MDVQFVASVAPIVRDADAARSFYQEDLGAHGAKVSSGGRITP